MDKSTKPPTWEEVAIAVTHQRDELRAENERLNGVHHADQYTLTLQASENERLRAALEKWRPAVERAVKWSEQLGNERDARGFAAMLADFDSALGRDKCR